MRPGAHGFEYFYGFLGSHEDYYHHNRGPAIPDLWENDRPIEESGYLTTLLTDKAVGFIERTSAARRPFFLELAYNAPHWPFQPPDRPSPPPGTGALQLPSDAGTATRADYVKMVEAMDGGVARVLAALDRLHLANDTLVIFTNDNGGEWLSDNAPLFSRKWTVWEGGIRVPALLRWPGHLPRGKVSSQVGITMDLTATVLAAAGASVPPDLTLDGIDLLPTLSGRVAPVERTLFWRMNLGNRTMRAVRSGDWKLLVDANHQFVFNLRHDLGERQDLTRLRPDVAQRLRPLLARWEQDVDAEAQRVVPDFVKLIRAIPGYIDGATAPVPGAAPVR
jgi:arylsulfatase A-like enzyme